MMGKSPLTKKLIGNQHRLPAELKAKIQASPEPGSSPAKIIPLLAGKAAALIGKKLLAKGVAKAGAKAAAKAGTKAATKKASGKLMEKSGKSLIDNEDNIRSKMKSKIQNKDEEDKKAPTTSLSSSNPYANQNTALQMKGKKPSPAKKESDINFLGELKKEKPKSFLSKNREKNQSSAINFETMFGKKSLANHFINQNTGFQQTATEKAKEEAKKTSSDTGSDTPPMKPIERAFQERGAAIIKRGQEKGAQRALDRSKGSSGGTSRSINRQITKSEKSANRVVKQGKRQEERTKRVALRNAPKSPKAKKADKVVKADKAIPNPTKDQEKGQGIIEKVTVEKTSKPNSVENAYTPSTKKQKNKKAKSDSRIESKRIRKTKNKETGKRIKRGETDDSFSGGKMVDGKVQLNTKRQALKDEKEKRKNIGKSPAEMKTKTPNKMMKKAPNKMMKKAPSKMMKKAPAKMMKKAPAKMMKKKK